MKRLAQWLVYAAVTMVSLPPWVSRDDVPVQVPTGHPRLWISTEAERERARAWLAATDEWPDEDDHAGNAFVAVLSGDMSLCAAPVEWLVAFTLPDVGNVSSDHARWYGEQAALVFDWCHAAMTNAQRNLVVQRWNGYLDALDAKPWGGPGLEANNYYWGYLRNDLNWAIATWHENPRAQDFLNHGLQTRYRGGFVRDYVPQFGIGGVPGEGTQYGRYMLGYPTVPFLTLQAYGQAPYENTNFFREALYHLVHSLVPGDTAAPPSEPVCDDRYRYLMPFNDDEAFFTCFPEVVRSTDYGMFLIAMSETAAPAQARHARFLFRQLQPRLPFWAMYRAPTGPDEGFGTLPLDYYAAGAGYVWTRSSWEPGSAAVMLQLGAPGGVGHRHLDTGSFQMWRGGEWISRETTSYTDHIVGYAGGESVDAAAAVGHNTVLLEGRAERGWESGGPRRIPAGAPRSANPDGLARVTRLHSTPAFLFAATDLTKAYRAERSEDPCRYDWPFAEHVEREFLFLRQLEALVVFDRVRSGNDSLAYEPDHCRQVGFSDYTGPRLAAGDVRKTFLAHFLAPVTRAGNVTSASVGAQDVRLHTMLPAQPTVRVIDERAGNPESVGQYRVEVETSGAAQAYFLHVLEAADTGVAPLQASLVTGPSPWRLTLSRPGSPTVVVELKAGVVSTNGAVVIDGQRTPLLDRVQDMWVDDQGPIWEPNPVGDPAAGQVKARPAPVVSPASGPVERVAPFRPGGFGAFDRPVDGIVEVFPAPGTSVAATQSLRIRLAGRSSFRDTQGRTLRVVDVATGQAVGPLTDFEPGDPQEGGMLLSLPLSRYPLRPGHVYEVQADGLFARTDAAPATTGAIGAGQWRFMVADP